MRRVFAGGGRMCVAVDEDVAGIGVYRIYTNTFDGLQMYVDDLVTDEKRRSRGFGKQLMDHMFEVARRSGCVAFGLDSGVQRAQAHRFYFREGLTVSAFHFDKPVK
jgi:GNAT superfamily N-acetyltransferase